MKWLNDLKEDYQSWKTRKRYPSPDAEKLKEVIPIPRWVEIVVALALIAFMLWCES